ncbi:replicative DNA helicase [Rummeliibacillus pycnus]|uniref:replicative DNA helicase n=1 Tax=Rummeliibacillus pycnus TaxID=101070 RepID=UPI0037CA3C44
MTKNISAELLEKSILGTMLEENNLVTDSGIWREMFQIQRHAAIFQEMYNLANDRKPVDYITLLQVMDPNVSGGATYLASLTNFACSPKFDAYCEMLITSWREKKKNAILFQAHTDDWSIESVQKALDTLQTDLHTTETNIQQDLLELEHLPFKPMPPQQVVPTNIVDLEKLIEGFRPSELTIIAGRPSMGKTDVMNHFALQAGWAGYLPIVFSLEMSKKILIERLISDCGKISRLKMRDPYNLFSEKQRKDWLNTLNKLLKAMIHIDDRGGITVNQIRAQARKIIHQNPARKPIIFIDYLQIITSVEATTNQVFSIGQISWALKQMAKELNCPVVCLSQLNRSVENRASKRPLMSDLRDSGNIEQDADVIILLYRQDYYEKLEAEGNMDYNKVSEVLELIVTKNRNGPTGTVPVNYSKSTGQIRDINNEHAK